MISFTVAALLLLIEALFLFGLFGGSFNLPFHIVISIYFKEPE